jgi:alpha-glucosidase (family GH31 glycosyl hydrolase)
MTAKHYQGLHYNLHSMYGLFQAVVTRSAFTTLNPNKRPFILSRSSFVGQGQYSTHWTGDINSDWSHLQTSIGDILNFNMFGLPFVGAEICGFGSDTTPELCLRWH